MDIHEKIMKLNDKDNKIAYQVLLELLEISEQCDLVYPYFDEFVVMMENKSNSFIRARGLSLIAYNSKWDVDNKINSIIDKYLTHIEDIKPITAKQCIKYTVIIAKYKPELIKTILEALEVYQHIYADSMQSLIYQDRQKAIKQIRQYTW